MAGVDGRLRTDPALAFVGYLVAAIFVGERILGTGSTAGGSERPYKGALVGIVVLGVIGIVPGIGGLATAVASLFGLGSVLLLGWRTIRRGGSAHIGASMQSPMPMGA